MKKFLIIGNMNAITYKEIFPYIKNNELWLGVSITSGDRRFDVPSDYPLEAATCGIDEDGVRFIRVKGVRWFTNLDSQKRYQPLDLYKHYNAEEYPKYDNYDAIEVSKTCEIPMDYDGVMGVPITFLDKYCPEQFELKGVFGSYKPETANIELGQLYGTPVKVATTKSLYRGPVVNSKATYARILIKKNNRINNNEECLKK